MEDKEKVVRQGELDSLCVGDGTRECAQTSKDRLAYNFAGGPHHSYSETLEEFC